MLKVMLVDDDVPMLRYMSKLIPWSELELELVATASSGKKALARFADTDPDLVITDIGMPHMDGLQLAAELTALKPTLRIVFLTCHKEFHYARKAVQLKAMDYLIKDELTQQQLTDSLRKAAQEIAELKRRTNEEAYRQDVAKHRELLKQQYFQDLLSSSAAEDTEDYGRRLGIRWELPLFMMAVGTIRLTSFVKRYKYEDVNLMLYAVSNMAEELQIDALPVTVFYDNELRFIVIHNYKPNLGINIQHEFKDYLAHLLKQMREWLHLEASVVFSAPLCGREQIGAHYAALRDVEYDCFYEPFRPGVWPSNVAKSRFLQESASLKELGNTLAQSFKAADEQAVANTFQAIRELAERERPEPERFVHLGSQWMRIIELEAKSNGREAFYRCLLQASRLEEAIGLMHEHVTQLMASRMKANSEPKLLQIDRYILDHLGESISMAAIADHLFLNPSYFSRYFKQKMGINFVDYVHQFKMKLACSYLRNKQESIETIALKLGYMERTYFSRVFKKYVGISPKDYR